MSDERNPWSIRGVSREARAKAAKAARRRRMTMGSWVDYVLSSAANAELTNRGPEGATDAGVNPPVPAAPGDLSDRVGAIEQREQALRAMVQRAAERSLVAADPNVPADNGARATALAQAVHGLVQRIETYLRPAAQLGDLIRRLDESDRRQVQMFRLMERMVEADQRRAADTSGFGAALARIEAKLGSVPEPRFEQLEAFAETRPRHVDVAPEVEALDFAAITEKAIANSRRSGQRPPDQAAGLADRLFGRKPD